MVAIKRERSRSKSRSRLGSTRASSIKRRYLDTWGRRHGEMSQWQRAAGIYNRAHFSPGTRVSANVPTARRPAAKRTLTFARKKRGGRIYGPGSIGKKFSNKVSSKTNKFVKYGYIRKRETGAVVTDTNCVYLGHNAIAMADMWKAITYAITRWFAKKAGTDFVTVDAAVLGLTTDPNLTWRITYKSTPDGLVFNQQATTAGAQTWGSMGDLLYGLILLAAGTQYIDLIQVELFSPDTVANVRDFPYICVEAKQFMIEVVGNSNMMLQNTTLASIVDADGDVTDNVTNNPLVGKQYAGKGQNFPVSFQNVTVGPTINLSPKTDFESGYIQFDWSGAGNMSASMRGQLGKPPPYYHFGGMTGNSYITLKPGEIRRSNVKLAIKHNLAKWVQMSMPFLNGGASTTTAQNMRSLGKVNFFGLEKILDSRVDEAPIRIAWECNLTTSAVAFYNPSVKAIPQIFVT